MDPALEDRLLTGCAKEVQDIADSVGSHSRYFRFRLNVIASFQIQRGVTLAKTEDVEALKGDILEWLTPPGSPLRPALHPRIKANRGFHHPYTGALLCPVQLDWSDGR